MTPVSRMEMLDERRVLLERREETQDERASAIGEAGKVRVRRKGFWFQLVFLWKFGGGILFFLSWWHVMYVASESHLVLGAGE